MPKDQRSGNNTTSSFYISINELFTFIFFTSFSSSYTNIAVLSNALHLLPISTLRLFYPCGAIPFTNYKSGARFENFFIQHKSCKAGIFHLKLVEILAKQHDFGV